MSIIRGLYGRARIRRASLVRLWLLVLLVVVPIGLRALERDVSHVVFFATRGTVFIGTDRWIFALERIIAIASYGLAGLAFDALGLKRTIAIVILAWALVVGLGATFGDPIAYLVLSPTLMGMLPGFVLVGLLLAPRLAFPTRRRGPWIAVLLAVYGHVAAYGVAAGYFPLSRDPHAVAWQYPMLALMTVGAVLFAIWLYGLREVDGPSGFDLRPAPAPPDAWTQIFRDSRVWSIIAIEVCLGIVWAQSLKLRWELGPIGDETAFWLPWVLPVAAIAAAWVSDRIYRKRRDWVAARRSLVVAGFFVAGVAPLFATLASQNSPALHIIDFVAIGTARVADLLVVDCAPRRFAGRYIGVVLAGETGVLTYLRPQVEGLALGGVGAFAVILVFAAAGAVAAIFLLPRMRPADS